MKPFYLHDAHGQIVAAGACADGDFDLQQRDGLTLREGAANYRTQYFDGTGLVDIPPQPSVSHVFDWLSKTWQDPRTLEDVKRQHWAAIKAARAAAEYGGFVWDGSRFDSDATSQGRIRGAVQRVAQTPDYAVNWTLADNTSRTLTAEDMAAVGLALGAHVDQQHVTSQALRAVIDAATTAAAVLAVAWPDSH